MSTVTLGWDTWSGPRVIDGIDFEPDVRQLAGRDATLKHISADASDAEAVR
jgi:hypothetical protein